MFSSLEGYSGLELRLLLRFWSLEWYSGFGVWSGNQGLELGVVHMSWSLEGYSGLELGVALRVGSLLWHSGFEAWSGNPV